MILLNAQQCLTDFLTILRLFDNSSRKSELLFDHMLSEKRLSGWTLRMPQLENNANKLNNSDP